MTEHSPPHSIELEQALLGAVLMDNAAYQHVSDVLKPDHFYEPLHRTLYETGARLIDAGKVANPVTIGAHLPAAADKIKVDGQSLTVKRYVARLAAEAVSVIHARDYADGIVALAQRREIIRTAAEVAEAARAGADPEIAEKARLAFGEIARAHASSSQIALTFFREFAVKPVRKLWLINGVMARGEVSSWIGKPGGGKSALLTDICAHGAYSPVWRGYRIPEPFGSVCFALERADLTRRRLVGQRLRDGLSDDLPIAVAGQIIDLIDPGCVDAMADAILRAQDVFGLEVGLAVIDTRSKGIAAGGGDEDKARFQNMAAANLRRVIERTGGRIHIASVGHTGKQTERGERGSNANLGDADVEVTISGDTTRIADVTKGNDQALGRLTAYDLEPYEFARDPHDEDSQPYRTFIVSRHVSTNVATAPRRALSDKQQLAIEALIEVLLSEGRDAPATYDLPKGTKVVGAEAWKAELYRRQVLDPDAKNTSARWTELRQGLQRRQCIGIRNNDVWIVASR